MFHLDRRADGLVEYGAAAGAPDDLLTSTELATWFGVSRQWVEVGRWRGYGPPYVRIGKRVRYLRCAVVDWLQQRVHASLTSYETPRRTHRPARPVELAMLRRVRTEMAADVAG